MEFVWISRDFSFDDELERVSRGGVGGSVGVVGGIRIFGKYF